MSKHNTKKMSYESFYTEAFLNEEQDRALAGLVRHKYPRICESWIEDAVQNAFVLAVTKQNFREVYDTQGAKAWVRLMRVVVIRQTRDIWRRKDNRTEAIDDHQFTQSLTPFDDAMATETLERIDALIESETLAFRSGSAGTELSDADLIAAVRDRFETGDSDKDVAARHDNVPRAYINKIKNRIKENIVNG